MAQTQIKSKAENETS